MARDLGNGKRMFLQETTEDPGTMLRILGYNDIIYNTRVKILPSHVVWD